MRVKAQGLQNAAAWVKEEHGEEALARVLSQCSPELRRRFQTAIAIEWHPMSEFTEFLEVAERTLPVQHPSVSESIGERGAHANTQGMLKRSAFFVMTPRFLLNRIASMWGQFNDKGEMTLAHLDQRYGLIELRGVPHPHVLFCEVLSGWVRVVSQAVGLRDPQVKHISCCAKDGNVCRWRFTWTGTTSKAHDDALSQFELDQPE